MLDIKPYVSKIINQVLMLILLMSGMLWGLVGLFKWNIMGWLAKHTIKGTDNIIYVIAILVAVFLLFSRDFFLPFLGETVFPCDPLVEKVPENADTSVTIKVEPNSNVIYWASETADEDIVDNPIKAYAKYKNSGVARSDENGRVTLRVRKPTPYKIPPFGLTLPAHIHYRICKSNGILSRVDTATI
jgi:uncharacterized membrane protein YuzA (DUF378 family)